MSTEKIHFCARPSSAPNPQPAWIKTDWLQEAKLCFNKAASGENVNDKWIRATQNGQVTESEYKVLLQEYGKELLPLCTLRLFAVVETDQKHACYMFTSKEASPENHGHQIVELYKVSAHSWERTTELMQEHMSRCIMYGNSVTD